jgi:hypothetical protein
MASPMFASASSRVLPGEAQPASAGHSAINSRSLDRQAALAQPARQDPSTATPQPARRARICTRATCAHVQKLRTWFDSYPPNSRTHARCGTPPPPHVRWTMVPEGS